MGILLFVDSVKPHQSLPCYPQCYISHLFTFCVNDFVFIFGDLIVYFFNQC